MSAAGEADAAVRALFKVNDVFMLPDGETEYRVAYDGRSAAGFEQLVRQLAPKGLVPTLAGSKEDCVLFVRKRAPLPKVRSRIPVVLALFTLASVAVFGYFEGEIYPAFGTGIPWYQAAILYSGAVVAILAVHEAAHRAMSRRSGTAPPTPFVIPGVPLVTSFLPSLGIISQQREPAVNRNRFFDYMVAGPLAALGLTLALYVAGELTSAASTLQAQGCQMVNGYITACQVNPSVFQVAVDWAVSGFAPAATAASRLSPLADAASVGFLLTFVGLLPLAFFDGGFIASAVLEDRFGRLATYLGVLALILFDTPNYWALAIVVLLMAGRPVSVQTYDEVSPISRSRRILFVALIAVALLSLPFPQNLGTFPLA